jgi:general secretion pathway protein H
MISPVHNSHGFTLIEMIVVMVVLALIAGLVIARGPMRSPTLEVRQAATSLQLALRGARSQAISSDHTVAVAIDPTGHSVRTGNASPLLLPASVALTVAVPGMARPQQGGVIRFRPDGSSSGGNIILAANALRKQVTVDWLTGRTRIADAR